MFSTASASSESEDKSSGSEYDPGEGTSGILKYSRASRKAYEGSSSKSSGSGDDIIVPQNVSNSTVTPTATGDHEPTSSKGKRKLRNPGSWKRNMKKQRLFVEKNRRREIPSCRCKCSNKLSISEQTDIFNRYSTLLTHAEQTIYLQGCVKKIENCRSRPRNKEDPRKRSTYVYNVTTNNTKNIVLCQKAFLSVHGIFKSRLERKVHTGAQPKDSRGCHSTRPNRTPKESLDLARKFISELPARESHYTRSDSRNRKYLDPNLSIAALHENFSHKHPDNKLSYGMFGKLFNEEFNISFGYPRKDICNVCTKLIVEMRQAQLDCNDNVLRNIKCERELHLKRAEVFKNSLTEAQKKSNVDKSEMTICFDFEKNLPLPVTNAQDEYYVSQLWLHVFGIHDLQTRKATMYVYTENFALKGPNEVISCLSDYIKSHKSLEQNRLKIFCDNAFSQNKNRYLFTFLDQLCKKNFFNRIEIVYPVPGHSMMPIDRDFAAIEKKRLKIEKVDNPESYIELIKSCRKKNIFDVVFVQHSLRSNGLLKQGDRIIKVQDFKNWIEPFSRSSVPRISKTRGVVFETGKPAQARETMTGLFSEMPLYKVGMNRKISNEPMLAYVESYLKIKDKKFTCVMKLLKLVTTGDIEFYKRTLLNTVNIAVPSRKDKGLAEENDIGSDTDIYE